MNKCKQCQKESLLLTIARGLCCECDTLRANKELANSAKVNMNDLCTVTLTEEGLKVLRNHLESFKIPEVEALYIRIASQGQFQLWELMSIFGWNCCCGGPNIFKDNTIIITKQS